MRRKEKNAESKWTMISILITMIRAMPVEP